MKSCPRHTAILFSLLALLAAGGRPACADPTTAGLDTPQGYPDMPIAIGGNLVADVSNAGVGITRGVTATYSNAAIGHTCAAAANGTTIMKMSSIAEQGLIECVPDSTSASSAFHWQPVGNGQVNSVTNLTTCDQVGQLNWNGKQVQVCNGTKYISISVSGGGQFMLAAGPMTASTDGDPYEPAVMDTTTGQTFQWSGYHYDCHAVAGYSSFMCFGGCYSPSQVCRTGWNWRQIAAPLNATPQRNQKYQISEYNVTTTSSPQTMTVNENHGGGATDVVTGYNIVNTPSFQAIDTDTGIVYVLSNGAWSAATVSVCQSNCYTDQ